MPTQCPKCSFVLAESGSECPKCGIVFTSYYAHLEHVHLKNKVSAETFYDEEPVYDPARALHKLNILTLPIAFFVAFLANQIAITRALGWYFFSIPSHEMGHAVMAWLGSRPALPLGALIPMAGMTMISEHRSMFFLVLQLCLLGYVGHKALRAGNKIVLLLLAVYTTLLLFMTFGISPDKLAMLVTIGGITGEFVLSTLVVVLFNYDLGKKIRWDFFRYFFLFAGSFSFVYSFSLWEKIRAGSAQMPIGSFLNGRGDGNGDIDKLIMTYGWMPRGVVDFFIHLGWICIAVMLVNYGVSFFRATNVAERDGDANLSRDRLTG
jgi:hypothetical protein